MVEVNQKWFIVLIALSIVCLLSIVGSLCVWVQESIDGSGYCNTESQAHRWKWMCVLTIFIVAVLQMARG